MGDLAGRLKRLTVTLQELSQSPNELSETALAARHALETATSLVKQGHDCAGRIRVFLRGSLRGPDPKRPAQYREAGHAS
jgi:hypothetical protein